LRWPIAIVVLGFVALTVLRPRSLDARWGAGLVLAILVSPLGWVHYLALTLAPMTALWSDGRWSRVAWASVIGLMVPVPLVLAMGRPSWIAMVTFGSLYSWAMMALFAAVLSADRKPEHQQENDHERHGQASFQHVSA
jgi:hypothetical protein